MIDTSSQVSPPSVLEGQNLTSPAMSGSSKPNYHFKNSFKNSSSKPVTE